VRGEKINDKRKCVRKDENTRKKTMKEKRRNKKRRRKKKKKKVLKTVKAERVFTKNEKENKIKGGGKKNTHKTHTREVEQTNNKEIINKNQKRESREKRKENDKHNI